ncbi:hypothetical protein [Rhodovastum atsumiense]|uniref:Uncharacterized protein n=1 Tax=Rhodovastum atsumiense TaxID=504468 RepID=A0A5M6IU08_9PROT|nr:hypothetical protein [Rhodovastum atsumiense]KAA5611803.1 hypothetical protein F1189_12240 [Rhodovastum atsumiense]
MQPTHREAYPEEPARCAVCGGDAHAYGRAWRREKAISESFGPSESLSVQHSRAVCCACVHFAIGKTFHATIVRRGLQVKLWPQASWRSYSHIFSESLGHIIPRREDWRRVLTSPPGGRFMAVMTNTGMKNLVYRGLIAEDGDLFAMLVEDRAVWVNPRLLGDIVLAFEAALADGLRRDDLLSGDYSAASIFKVGRATWQVHEEAIGQFRRQSLHLLRLVHAIAASPAR